MADRRFYAKAGPFSLTHLATLVQADVQAATADLDISDVAGLASASAADISFLANAKYTDSLTASRAGAVLVAEKHKDKVPDTAQALVCADPYRAMAEISCLFYPQAARAMPMPGTGQQQQSVHPEAELGENVTIGYGAMVEAGAQIGDGTIIAAGAVIGAGVAIGRDCLIGANCVIGFALIGDRVIIHANTTIGSDGYGYAPGASHFKIPQLGRVIIQADVEIGANCTIDRGSMEDTQIGEGSKLDNQVHMAHNVKIGRHCFLTGQNGLAGSASLGDYVQMGGQAGIAGHVHVGDKTMVGAQALVLKSVPENSTVSGTPARPLQELYRDQAFIRTMRRGEGK